MAQNRTCNRVVAADFESIDHAADDEHKLNQNGSSLNTTKLKEEISVEKFHSDEAEPHHCKLEEISGFDNITLFCCQGLLFVTVWLCLLEYLNLATGEELQAWNSTNFFHALKDTAVSFISIFKQQFIITSDEISCSFVGGFGSYLFGMSERIASVSSDTNDLKNPKLGWIIAFLFVVSFLGLFSVVPLRKIMIIGFKLTYPSGTATAHLINSFHTPQGAKLAKFYFDFSAIYIGVGMICPYIINISVLIGGILSWGLMWPLIENKEGHWYKKDLGQSNLRGIQGYRIFIAIAMILGDGLYNMCKVLYHTCLGLFNGFPKEQREIVLPVADRDSPSPPQLSYDDLLRTQLFCKDQIPTWVAVGCDVAFAAICTATLPHIFHQLKWYYILVIYLIARTLAFCNAYGCGLTDWSMASFYGKLAIFFVGAWAGPSNGGVLASLAACGVMMNIVSTAADLMQDFKTGYLTLASPRAMFVSQLIGTSMGCVISPCVFWIFYKAFPDLGATGSEYPAPYAILYRNMAILGVEGFSQLPKNCFLLCCIFFGSSIGINLIKDLLGKRGRFVPLPMAMAIPFYIGPYFAIDMCVGSLILFVWEKINKANAHAFGPAVASGLICGDGIWTLPASILALAGVKPPICMKFLSRATNARVDAFLGN
ncbi:hypothetical protein RIF29_06328 [Crotalaria pallida]|uniref:Metal-nicotianamine transporter YSL7 n=1 Tax=Crotalaria pallida TaxID=3830 RepID=A0AAN9J3C2_CROPI